MTVLAVHEIKDDVTPAEKFGDVRYINKFYIHGDELEREGNDNLIPTNYRVNMERALADFVPGRDFLLISGDHLQLLAFTTLLAGRFPFFDVLRWDRQLRDYIPVRLYSGVVPSPTVVLSSSGTDIGETDRAKIYNNAQNYIDPVTGIPLSEVRAGFLESLLARRSPKRTP